MEACGGLAWSGEVTWKAEALLAPEDLVFSRRGRFHFNLVEIDLGGLEQTQGDLVTCWSQRRPLLIATAL